MRKVLIRLVAVETALVGWLVYWLFLVYANNPSASQGLASQLVRFPQLSYTTVDITVVVVIAILSITLAFKFQRGLKPGIRLERALQMLESLMKRNLVLEAQVTELKLEKAHITSSALSPTMGEAARPGSWEKAFRTPIEAGPPPPMKASGLTFSEPSFELETPMPHAQPPKIEPKPPSQVKVGVKPPIVAERLEEKPPPPGASFHSTWEDSQKHVSETRGILTPSPPPRRPGSVFPESGSSRQPYIPAPAPKAPPPGVIVGPGRSPVAPQTKPPGRTTSSLQTSSKSALTPLGQQSSSTTGKPAAPLSPPSLGPAKPALPGPKPTESPLPATPKPPTEGEQKTTTKPSEAVKKRFPYEED